VSIHYSHRGVLLAVLTATVATSSCGGGGGGGSAPVASTPPPAPPTSVRPVEQTNLQIAQTVYAGPRTPADFFADNHSANENVATTHLKNSDVDVTASASAPLYELCTNDWNQALDWSETRAQNSPSYADLVETNDDARYFEFGRARSGDPDFYVRDRVFKCTYVDRSSANLRLEEGAAGLLNMRPLTAEELRTLSEYLWSFTAYNNFGYAVLKSGGAPTAEGLTHTLYIAALQRNGLSATCDRINVLSWRHALNTSTGQLTLDVEPAFSFGARESGGVAETCSE
jgi:hypothetical protein